MLIRVPPEAPLSVSGLKCQITFGELVGFALTACCSIVERHLLRWITWSGDVIGRFLALLRLR